MAKGKNNRHAYNVKSYSEIAREIRLQIIKLILEGKFPAPNNVQQGLQIFDLNIFDQSTLPYNVIREISYDPISRKIMIDLNNFCEETFMFVRENEHVLYGCEFGCTCNFVNLFTRFSMQNRIQL
jgi:hypothetical protein